MSATYQHPDPGCYRLVRGIRVQCREESGLAICDYPMRVVRLNTVAAHLLALCQEQRTTGELAQQLHLPIKRVEVLCEQLCRRGLLEAGPMLPPTEWPPVSILVPSRNRAKQLERCLRSLLALDYPPEALEIIVIDDASMDETATMLHHLAEETTTHGRQLRVIYHSSKQGVGRGRNTGAEAASYDLLAYIDSDCVASPGWLKELVPAFQDARTAAVGGMLRAYERTSMIGRYEDVRSSLFMGVRAQEVRFEGPLTYVPTANLLLRREAWQQLGGFEPLNFGEDVDLCRRLLAAGYRIRYLPYGTVYHDYRTRLRDFLRTRAAYASSEAVLLQLHPNERRILLLPPEQASFAGLAIGGLWGVMWESSHLQTWNGHPSNVGGQLIAPEKRMDTHECRPVTPSHGRNQLPPYVSIMLGLMLALFGAYRRWRKVRGQGIAVGWFAVMRATLRGHLAYTYHLCRHLTRYYTLPILLMGLLLPPLLPLALIPCAAVIGVDYVRLRPDMGVGEYALCSLLDDCAYGVGVVWGCIQQRTWKPLVPVIKRKIQ